MTFQQLEYIVALNKYRHFVTASKKCGISQPTLSLMIKKLEEELDLEIFDRSKHPIAPTRMGAKLIAQAEITLKEKSKINELVIEETNTLSGKLVLGIIPTISPYLLPEFISKFKHNFPNVNLVISEQHTSSLIQSLQDESIDMFIAATPLNQDSFFEIPLYYEKFLAYFSEKTPSANMVLSADNMPKDNLWVLEEGHCLRDQTFNFCKDKIVYNQIFEAGSIDTLIRIVDKNGGYSVIPELHLDFLNPNQKNNICEITSPPAVREVSVVIKKHFIRQALINAVADTVKAIIPEDMIDERLKRFAIKL